MFLFQPVTMAFSFFFHCLLFHWFLKAIKIYVKKKKKRKGQYAHERYRNIFIEKEPVREEKNRKCKYACEQYRFLSEGEKEKKGQCTRELYRKLSKNIINIKALTLNFEFKL